jgi:hypothetical protein
MGFGSFDFTDFMTVIKQIKAVEYPGCDLVDLDVVQASIGIGTYDPSGDIPVLEMPIKLGREYVSGWIAGDNATELHELTVKSRSHVFVCDPRRDSAICIVGVQITDGKFVPLATSPEEALNTARIASLPC